MGWGWIAAALVRRLVRFAWLGRPVPAGCLFPYPYPRRRGRPLDPRRLWVWGRRVGGGSESAAAVANCDRFPDRSNRNVACVRSQNPKGVVPVHHSPPPLHLQARRLPPALGARGMEIALPVCWRNWAAVMRTYPPSQGQGRQIHRAALPKKGLWIGQEPSRKKEGTKGGGGLRGGRGEAAASGALSRAVHVARSSFAGREDYQVRTYSTPIPNTRSIGARRIASGFDRSGP